MRDIITRNNYNTLLENGKYTPKNEIEQIAQGLKNIINKQIQWCNNKKMIQVRVTNMETKYAPISVTMTFPTTITTTRTATKHMLTHHHTVPISQSL